MLEQYKIPLAYTIESSNGSYYDSETKLTIDFTREKWMEMGHQAGVCLSEYICMLEEYDEFVNQKRESIARRRVKYRAASSSYPTRSTRNTEKNKQV